MFRYCVFYSLNLIACFAFGQKMKLQKQTPLFTINGTHTYADEFIYTFKKNRSDTTVRITEQMVTEFLHRYIQFKLKVAEAHALRIDTTAKFINEFKIYREELKKPYRTEPDLLEKLTHETYERLKQEVRVSHVLVSTNTATDPKDTLLAYQKLASIRKRILAGESFDKLAREVSDDPSGKYNGGDLGYFTALHMVYPFEIMAYTTPVDSISPIFRTRFGYHIIKVIDKRESRGEVEVSHILFRAEPDNQEQAKNKAYKIFDHLKKGQSWDELCKANSDDTNTKNIGGKLNPFGVRGIVSVPEFENAALSLTTPGQITDPFPSHIGWHIIKLDKKIPLPPYSQLAETLKRRIAHDERLQISQAQQMAKRKNDFHFREFESTKKSIFSFSDSSLLQGNWNYKGPSKLTQKPLFMMADKIVLVADFITYLAQIQQPLAGITPLAAIELEYNRFVEETIQRIEEEKLIAKNPHFKNVLNEYRDGLLYFEIMEKEIWIKASEDSIGQRTYYNNHLDQFQAGDRVEARIFSTPEKDIILNFKKKVDAQDTLTKSDLEKFKSIQPFKNYERGVNTIIDRVPWITGLHELNYENMYYLVEIARLIAPGTKTYTEARASIIEAYQAALEKKWIETLEKKYAVKIHKKRKREVIESILKK